MSVHETAASIETAVSIDVVEDDMTSFHSALSSLDGGYVAMSDSDLPFPGEHRPGQRGSQATMNSTHDDETSKHLFDLLEEGHWDAVRLALQQSPQVCREARDIRKRRTLLHRCCELDDNSAPLDIIESLCTTFPEALVLQDVEGNTPLHCAAWISDRPELIRLVSHEEAALTIRDWYGNTPLHLACLRPRRTPLSLLQALSDACPQAAAAVNVRGNTPLHDAAGNGNARPDFLHLLGSARAYYPRDARLVTNAQGSTPLHVACARGLPWACLKPLLWDNDEPPVFSSGDVYQQTPLCLMCVAHHSALHKAAFQLVSQQQQQQQQQSVNHNFFQSEAWHGITSMICWRAACSSFLLHAAIYAEGLSMDCMQLLLVACRNDLWRIDADGNLPLHVAAMRPSIGIMGNDSLDWVGELVRLEPKAAQMPNAHEQLPLELAIHKSSEHWNQDIETLIAAHPGGLLSLDYFSDALVARILSRFARKHKPNVIYGLLRELPGMLFPKPQLHDAS